MPTRICFFMLAILLSTAALAEEPQRIEIKPVLLVMDIQNAWMPRMDQQDVEAALPGVNEAIALFREFEQPIIRVYHSDERNGPDPESEGFEFDEAVAIQDSDPQIVKHRASAFSETELAAQLKEMDVNTVFLCGLSATGCVLATYFGGHDRDFYTIMIKGALISHKAEYTDVIEEICWGVTLEELREALADPYFE